MSGALAELETHGVSGSEVLRAGALAAHILAENAQVVSQHLCLPQSCVACVPASAPADGGFAMTLVLSALTEEEYEAVTDRCPSCVVCGGDALDIDRLPEVVQTVNCAECNPYALCVECQVVIDGVPTCLLCVQPKDAAGVGWAADARTRIRIQLLYLPGWIGGAASELPASIWE